MESSCRQAFTKHCMGNVVSSMETNIIGSGLDRLFFKVITNQLYNVLSSIVDPMQYGYYCMRNHANLHNLLFKLLLIVLMN